MSWLAFANRSCKIKFTRNVKQIEKQTHVKQYFDTYQRYYNTSLV